MDSNTITALATGLLALVGVVQIGILKAHRRQAQLELIEQYHRRWIGILKDWGVVIFIGRDEGEYYQVLGQDDLKLVSSERDKANNSEPTTWALDAARMVFSNFSDVCMRILQGHIAVRDVYPFFGTELLRHSRPIRVLLDNSYSNKMFYSGEAHRMVREEIQDWLIYHDGIRRRCLILFDLLWAEAARLEDLPPSDLLSAAEAKKNGSSH